VRKKATRKVARKRPKPRQGLDRPYNGGKWTTSKFHEFIRRALRRASARWGPSFEVLKDAETGKCVNAKTGRIAMHYRCAGCGGSFPRKDVQVDHIVPVGGMNDLSELADHVRRLFVEKDGYQVLCTDKCHHHKTQNSP
jgi:hypothetical protein